MSSETRVNAEKVLEEIGKDAGKTTREIGKTIGISDDYVRKLIRWLEASEGPEAKKLLAKRAAYARGGAYIVKEIKKEPGSSYRLINARFRTDAQKDRRNNKGDVKELLRGLIMYCKKYKDEELRDILLKHKNAGGWMP